MDRNEYIQKLQADLDRWNGQIHAWEETVRDSHGDLHGRLKEYLASWRDQRNLAAHKLREVEVASGEALAEILSGADQAWQDLAHSYELARQRFEAHAKAR